MSGSYSRREQFCIAGVPVVESMQGKVLGSLE
jgi:hypothetical protein